MDLILIIFLLYFSTIHNGVLAQNEIEKGFSEKNLNNLLAIEKRNLIIIWCFVILVLLYQIYGIIIFIIIFSISISLIKIEKLSLIWKIYIKLKLLSSIIIMILYGIIKLSI